MSKPLVETTASPEAAPKRESLWPARLALLLVIALQVLLSRRVTLQPNWALPALETLLLIPLASVRGQYLRRLRKLEREIGFHPAARRLRDVSRVLAFTLVALTSLVNFVSLALLVLAMLHGSKATGRVLLLDALNIWATNIIVYALWYWELDRGGPLARHTKRETSPDFLFTQMSAPEGVVPPNWSPTFMDYLFLAFTNAMAFSPTDTLPLTTAAKALMMVQALTSLLTIAFVAARAVNILG